MDRLEFLLQRYKNNTATPEEMEELSGLMDMEFVESSGVEKLADTAEEDLQLISKKLDSVPLTQPARIVRFKRSAWLAAAAVITLAIVATALLTTDLFNTSPLSQQPTARRMVYTDKQLIELPDGTQVLLNDSSELSFDSASFGLSNREVTLRGEAFFDVKHDPSKRFIVKTGEVNTQVLGTAFNVRAYSGAGEITVTVVRGLVQVGDDRRVYAKINPNEQIAVDVENHTFIQKGVVADEVVSWQKNFLIMEDLTLEEASRIIEKRFDVQIRFENEMLKKCVFSGTFLNDESLDQVLSIMTKVIGGVDYHVKGSEVTFSGKGCN